MSAPGAIASTISVSSTSSSSASQGDGDWARLFTTCSCAVGRRNRLSKRARSWDVGDLRRGRTRRDLLLQQHHRFTTAVDPTIKKRLNTVGRPELLRGVAGQLLQAVMHGNTRRAGRQGSADRPPADGEEGARQRQTRDLDRLRQPAGTRCRRA